MYICCTSKASSKASSKLEGVHRKTHRPTPSHTCSLHERGEGGVEGEREEGGCHALGGGGLESPPSPFAPPTSSSYFTTGVTTGVSNFTTGDCKLVEEAGSGQEEEMDGDSEVGEEEVCI